MTGQINPNFNSIATEFCKHYYQVFDTNREGLATLYHDTSMMTFEGEQFQGSANIMNKLRNVQFKKVRHVVSKLDCQPGPNMSVVASVAGQLFVDDSAVPIKFAQMFNLGQAGGSYFIQNDLFRLNC